MGRAAISGLYCTDSAANVAQIRLLLEAIRFPSLPVSAQQSPDFLGDPDRSNQKVDRPLKKRRMIAFNAMAQEKKDPTAHEKRRAPNPLGKNQQYDTGKNHGNTDAMEGLIPSGRMLMVVLRHVSSQTWH
jgi:hypothetical protein